MNKFDQLLLHFVSDKPTKDGPLHMPCKRNGLVCATNAHAMIVIPSDLLEGEYNDIASYPDFEAIANKALRHVDGKGEFVDVAAHFENIPTAPIYEQCPECEGWGKKNCPCCDAEHKCSDCNGTGRTQNILSNGVHPDIVETSLEGIKFQASELYKVAKASKILGEKPVWEFKQPMFPTVFKFNYGINCIIMPATYQK